MFHVITSVTTLENSKYMKHWDYPIIITVKGRQRTFYVSTKRNILPKGNEHWYNVSVKEHGPAGDIVSFDFLHHINTKQTEISRFYSLMPVKEICEEMHRQVADEKEQW